MIAFRTFWTLAVVTLLMARGASPVLAQSITGEHAKAPLDAEKTRPFQNHLGMRFVPIDISDGPTETGISGKKILFSIWETRVSDFRAFVKETGYKSQSKVAETEKVADPPRWDAPGFEQTEDHPVTCVSPKAAIAFAEWLSKKEGIRYRLPTDHEWSNAVDCTGWHDEPEVGWYEFTFEDDTWFEHPLKYEMMGKSGWTNNELMYPGKLARYPWGNEFPPKNKANLLGEESADGFKSYRIEGYKDAFPYTNPVGTFDGNIYGLYDLGGNVREICVPSYGTPPSFFILRGGSWAPVYYTSDHDKLSSRARTHTESDKHSADIGFRLVIEVNVSQPRPPTPDPAKFIPDKRRTAAADKDFTNTSGQNLVWIPPGEFKMGIAPSQYASLQNSWAASSLELYDLGESTLHPVKLTNGFWLGKYETTIAEYAAFLNAKQKPGEEWVEFDNEFCPLIKKENRWEMRPQKGPTWGDAKQPMVCVTWFGATAFTQWLNEKEKGKLPEGYAYTLPTEAQWEFACRAGTSELTYAGDLTIEAQHFAWELDPISWYAGNSGVNYESGWNSEMWHGKHYPHRRAASHPVGSKKPNRWQLYDMLGNVYEWCANYSYPYEEQLSIDPYGPEEGNVRMARGGSWFTSAVSCRASKRVYARPEASEIFLGFRIALTKTQ